MCACASQLGVFFVRHAQEHSLILLGLDPGRVNQSVNSLSWLPQIRYTTVNCVTLSGLVAIVGLSYGQFLSALAIHSDIQLKRMVDHHSPTQFTHHMHTHIPRGDQAPQANLLNENHFPVLYLM